VTTTTASLMDAVVAALRGATQAQNRVFAPRDWPTFDGVYPAILVQAVRERKESLGRNVPQFTVTSTLRITGRVSQPAGATAAGLPLGAQGADAGAIAIEDALWSFQREIETAVINAYGVTILVQQFPSIEAQIMVSAEGKNHLGEVAIDLGLEFYQGPEDFAPPNAIPVTQLGLVTDLTNVFDPSGTYASEFPAAVTPAPRTTGPDGRTEGGVLATLPQ
jgi:hypothetical protein